MKFHSLMMSCIERAAIRSRTLQDLAASGWTESPELVLDDGLGETRIARIRRTWRKVIRRAGQVEADGVLLLEDDVVFGRWFAHNLKSWAALSRLRDNQAFFGSLYNPGMPYLQQLPAEHSFIAYPGALWGAQALVVTPPTARYIDATWEQADGNPDQRMPRLAARITPIYYHVPSLVDHARVETTWGGQVHGAKDFDPDWRAPGRLAGPHNLAGSKPSVERSPG